MKHVWVGVGVSARNNIGWLCAPAVKHMVQFYFNAYHYSSIWEPLSHGIGIGIHIGRRIGVGIGEGRAGQGSV